MGELWSSADHDPQADGMAGKPFKIASTRQCDRSGWVCEEHPRPTVAGRRACPCGSAGMPCPRCNRPVEGKQPRLLEGFRTEFDKDGSSPIRFSNHSAKCLLSLRHRAVLLAFIGDENAGCAPAFHERKGARHAPTERFQAKPDIAVPA